MIRVEGLHFRYPGATEPALCDLSFSVAPGEAVAVVGGSGAGKSTLLRVLAGFVPSLVHGERAGKVELQGEDPGTAPPARRLARAGLLFSDPSAQLSGICPTVIEEVAWGLGNLGVPREEMRPRVERVLDRLGLAGVAEKSPFALSGGQQQRVALAAVLALAPAVLLLDEPVAMLDPQGRREVLSAALDLASGGHAVLWATPHLEEAAAFPRWLVLERGTLVQDGAAAIPSRHEAREAAWTRLAREAAERGLWSGPWPVREDEAEEGLRR